MPKRISTTVLPIPTPKKQKPADDEDVIVARKKLIKVLEEFERDDTISDAPGVVLSEYVGAIMFQHKGKKVACALSLMRDMLENDEVDNNRNTTSEAKEIMEDRYAPVSKFAENLEILSIKLLEMAALTRAAGLDTVKTLDDESECSEDDGDDDEDVEDLDENAEDTEDNGE
jgi:hypothetical protein